MDGRVQSLERAFALLELLGQSDHGRSISDLAARSGLPLGTAHRLLHTLLALGYDEQDEETWQYGLGLRFLHMHGLVIRRLNLAERAMPQMKALMRRVNETVHLAVLDGPDVVYIDQVEGLQTIGMYTQIGKRALAHATALDKAMLAFMPDTVWRSIAEQHGLPPLSPTTITTPEEFAKELQRARQRSFAIDMAAAADPIGLVLYNPPRAKRVLAPAAYGRLASAVPGLVGIKVVDGGPAWYAEMRRYAAGLSIFVPGHRLASGIAQGATGAYSNVACLQPTGAQRWYEQILSDPAAALALESRIQGFMAQHIEPFITQQGYSNQAVDKLLAAVGGWADVGTRLRWPYRSISADEADRLRPIARTSLPELFEE